MKSNPFNKYIIAILIIAAVAAAAAFFYRFAILQYTAETIIRNALPEYVRIDKISFGFIEGRVSVAGFKIINPPGFGSPYLIEISEVSCRYAMRGKSILDGVEIQDPVFKNPVLSIERLPNGQTNLEAMSAMVENRQGGGSSKASEEGKARVPAGEGITAGKELTAKKKFSDIVKLPESYLIKNGKLVFVDGLVSRTPTTITFENIYATLGVRLNGAYTQIVNVASIGEGSVNGDKKQAVKWNVVYDPLAPSLTMSNRFDVSGVELKTFEPYYDKYSPLVFSTGNLSGTLVFDFDNGNIGSTNEVRLSHLSFSIKPGAENAEFWGTTVPDLARYFTTASGDVLFDFKIKGSIQKPDFYLGPISKRALTVMAVDKISAVLSAVTRAQAKTTEEGDLPAQSNEGAQVEAISDAIKMLMKKAK